MFLRSLVLSLIGLMLRAAVAGAQPPQIIHPTQIVHTFDQPPLQPYGGLVEAIDGNLYGTTSVGGTGGGTIYRLAPGGGPAVVVHRFADGSYPDAALIRGADGRLFGTTRRGGVSDHGTVFRFDPVTSRLQTLHAFTGESEPIAPVGPLLLAADGSFYGVAEMSQGSAIYRVEPVTFRAEVVRAFDLMDGIGEGPVGGLCQAGTGRLYGVMSRGGAANAGTIYRLDLANRNVAVAYSFAAPGLQRPASGLRRAADGRLYGTAASGGADDAGGIIRLDPATDGVTVVHELHPSNGVDARAPITPLLETSNGDLWGTAESGPAPSGGAIYRLHRQSNGTFSYATVGVLDPDAIGVNATGDPIAASDGWIYATAAAGGPAKGGSVIRLDALERNGPGAFQFGVRHAFSALGTGWRPAAPPTLFADGWLYGTTTEGGSGGDGDVYRMHPTTGATTTVGALPVDDTWLSPLVDAGNGSLYAAAAARIGTDAHIVRVTPATSAVTVVATYTRALGPDYITGLVRIGTSLYGLRETAAGLSVFRFVPATNAITSVGVVTTTPGFQTTLGAGVDGQLYVITTPSPLTQPVDAIVYRVDPVSGTGSVVATSSHISQPAAPVQTSDGTLFFAGANVPYDVRVLARDAATGVTRTACDLGGGGLISALSPGPNNTVYVVVHDIQAPSRVTLYRCDAASSGAQVLTLPDGEVASGIRFAGSTTFYGASFNHGGGAVFRGTVAGQPLPLVDADGDGLDDAWEAGWGLDPGSASGADGASGDPDGDGQSNLAEQAAGTHPRAMVTRYLAEGAANAFFSTRIAIANPGDDVAHVVATFLTDDGHRQPCRLTVPPRSRRTIEYPMLGLTVVGSFSTVIESDVLVTVDRTMSWDAGGYGSHMERAVDAPATTWYLAEGSTSGDFSLFYLLQNAQSTAVTAQVRYLRPFGLPFVERTYTLPAHSRTTIPVDTQAPEIASSDVSAVITATAPIIAERAMYASRPGQAFAAGHDSAGVTAPALEWFLAEGATGQFFDLFVLIANPNPTPATLQVDYLLLGGGVRSKTYAVPANGRFTIWVDDEQIPAGSGLKPLANAAISTIVRSTNGVPVIVERTMWWPGPEASANFWYEAHNSPGATATALRWSVADAEVGGSDGAETYVLIANTAAVAGRVLVRVQFEDGNATGRYYDLAPSSRTNVPLSADFPEARGYGRMAVLVESVGASAVPIVVEHATYASPQLVLWASGSNALATPVP